MDRIFYVPIQYPSGIWRVQKMREGYNGTFVEVNWDNVMYAHRQTYKPAFIHYSACKYYVDNKNVESWTNLWHEVTKATMRFINMEKYMTGFRGGLPK